MDPPRRSLVPKTFRDMLAVTASTGLLNVTLTVPPQKPTGFPLESTVGHSDRGTPTAPLMGLVDTIAKALGLGLGLLDCEPQPMLQIAKKPTTTISLFAILRRVWHVTTTSSTLPSGAHFRVCWALGALQVLLNGVLSETGPLPNSDPTFHLRLRTCYLPPIPYFISRQFGPAFKSTTSGTASSCTCSIDSRTSGRRRSISSCGASKSSSSWTCKIIFA